MTAATPVTIRVPLDVLERLRAAVKSRGVTLTDLLLGPWRGEPEAVAAPPRPPLMPGSPTTVAAPARSKTAVVEVVPFKSRLKGEWKAP